MEEKENGTPETGGEKGTKGKNFLSGWGKYVKELSVIVVGVAITLIASGWITNHREKRELRNHLQAVRVELESNLELAKRDFEYYDRLLDFSFYLATKQMQDHTIEEIENASRMDNGESVMNRLYYYMPIETVSFEALRQSGTSKHIKDQDLWRSIMQSYKALEELKHENDVYMLTKLNYIFDVMKHSDENSYDITSPEGRPIYNFYRSQYHFHNVFEKVFESIEQTLSRL